MTTRVFIIPDAYRDAGDQMAIAMEWSSEHPVFVQPLSADGSAPPTHWGFPAVIGPEFLETWANPPAEAAALVAVIQIDDREGDDTAEHWWACLADRGLAVVQEDDVI